MQAENMPLLKQVIFLIKTSYFRHENKLFSQAK